MDEREEPVPQSVSRKAGAGEEDRKVVRTADNRSRNREDEATKIKKKEEGKVEVRSIEKGITFL